MSSSYYLVKEYKNVDEDAEQPLTLLETVLLYALSILLVVLMFGKEGFLVAGGTIFGRIIWFITSGLALAAQYGGIPLGIACIALKVVCNPRSNVLGELFSGLGLWMIFGLYMIVGSFVTTAPAEALWHKHIMYTNTLPAVVMTISLLFFGRRGISIIRNVVVGYAFLLVFVMLLSRSGVIGSAMANEQMEDRYAEGNVIFTARTLYYCAFSLMFWGFLGINRGVLFRAMSLLGACIAVFVGFSTGARGPLVATILSLFIWLIFLKAKLRLKLLIAGCMVIMLVGGWVIVGHYTPAASEHLSSTDDSGRGQYAYSVVLRSSPTVFGRGTGSFALVSSLVYPHNLFLEMYYEHGVVGLLILLILCVDIAWRLLRMHLRYNNRLSLWIFISAAYFFFCAQVSGAIVQHIGLWVFALIGSKYSLMENRVFALENHVPSIRRVNRNALVIGANEDTV